MKSVAVRVELLNDWFTNGGVMIMGYEVFRVLTHTDSVKYSKHKEAFRSMLLDPGKFIGAIHQILRTDIYSFPTYLNLLGFIC